MYNNEHEIGQAIEDCVTQGIVKREDLFITTKVWMTYMRPDLVRKSFEESVSKLKLSYVDLYLIHWPTPLKEDQGDELMPKDENGKYLFSDFHFVDTWKAMEKLVDEGLAKSIGVSNFNHKQIEELLAKCRIKPVMNQVEVHGYLNNAKLIDFCHAHDIQVTAYCPLCNPAFPETRAVTPCLLEDPVVVEVAKKYGKSPGQTLIRWALDRKIVVIPKSVTPARIRENFNVFDFKLAPEDIAILNSLNRKDVRICTLPELLEHPLYPFHEEF